MYAIRSYYDDILNKLTKDGFAFRVDFKIRPDNKQTSIATDIEFAKNYYTNYGQSWEKATLVRARHITGDTSVSKDFINFTKSWIWKEDLSTENIINLLSIVITSYSIHYTKLYEKLFLL